MPWAIAEQGHDIALRLVRDKTVRTLGGGELRLDIKSICIHGKAPNAAEIAAAIRARLESEGVQIAALRELVRAEVASR